MTVLAIVLGFCLGAAFSSVEGHARSAGTPRALQAVLADAAARTGVDPRSLQLVRAEPTEWPDGSLGCPQPGQLYPQVITPGWRVEVQAGGKTFEYHTDEGDRFVFCAER